MPKVDTAQQRATSAAPSTPMRRTPARSRYSSATPSRTPGRAALSPSGGPSNAQPAAPASPSKKKGASAVYMPFPPVPADEEHLWDVLYTDGACSNNGKGAAALAGIGVWSAEDEGRRLSERCPGEQTNNRAELIAIIRALESTPFGGKQLLVKTDSEYALNCVYQWMRKWSDNGWKTAAGQPVKNQQLLRYLSALLQLRDMRGKVRLQHVRGHNGDTGNEAADALARAGALLPPVEEEDDWETKLQDMQGQIDGELLGMSDVHAPGSPRKAKPKGVTAVLMSPGKSRVNAPSLSPGAARVVSPIKVKARIVVFLMSVVPEDEDDEFPDADDAWMEDLDEAELAKLDSSPAKQPAASTSAARSAADDDFDFDDPFADLTAEQLDALDRPQR
ncbi:ribonuclease H-like protein [Auricularia subglabra TFB-10046 SS5]|nr:ribonuclease H-like protein [Auricularia subglabra TFB-10046 SS5]